MAEVLFRAKLQRVAPCNAWGFRLQGGTEYNKPLTLLKVVDESEAAQAGLHAGDILVKLAGLTADGMTHKEAQQAIITAGNSLEIIVERLDATKPQPTPPTPKLPHRHGIDEDSTYVSPGTAGVNEQREEGVLVYQAVPAGFQVSPLVPQVVNLHPAVDHDEAVNISQNSEEMDCNTVPDMVERNDNRPLDRRKLAHAADSKPQPRPNDDDDIAQHNATQARPQDIPPSTSHLSFNATDYRLSEEETVDSSSCNFSSNGISCDIPPLPSHGPDDAADQLDSRGVHNLGSDPLPVNLHNHHGLSEPEFASLPSTDNAKSLQQVSCQDEISVMNSTLSPAESMIQVDSTHHIASKSSPLLNSTLEYRDDMCAANSLCTNDNGFDVKQFVHRTTIPGYKEPPDKCIPDNSSSRLPTISSPSCARKITHPNMLRETLCVSSDACSLCSSDSEYSSDSSMASVIYQSEPHDSKPVSCTAPWRKRTSSGSSSAPSPPTVTTKTESEMPAINVQKPVIENSVSGGERDANENILVPNKVDVLPVAADECVYFANVHTTNGDTAEELELPTAVTTQAAETGSVMLECEQVTQSPLVQIVSAHPASEAPATKPLPLPPSSAPWRKPRPEPRPTEQLSDHMVDAFHASNITDTSDTCSSTKPTPEAMAKELDIQMPQGTGISQKSSISEKSEVAKTSEHATKSDPVTVKSDGVPCSIDKHKKKDKLTSELASKDSSGKMSTKGDTKAKSNGSTDTNSKGSSKKDNTEDKKSHLLPKKSIINTSDDQDTSRPPFVLTHDITGRAIFSPGASTSNKPKKKKVPTATLR